MKGLCNLYVVRYNLGVKIGNMNVFKKYCCFLVIYNFDLCIRVVLFGCMGGSVNFKIVVFIFRRV